MLDVCHHFLGSDKALCALSAIPYLPYVFQKGYKELLG